MKDYLIEITEQNFESVMASGMPVMVEFGAEWCHPCRSLIPVMKELANGYEGKAVIGSCDVEENNDIAVKYSIRSVPTILFFKDGEEVSRQVGAIARSVLEEKLKALV